eukprot:GHVU01230814.1.p1 GENE.GHVU01230814.1~~GHVU01230814.1.p1  ORF type:complete len:282 (-),score=15.52 GHVU01230814.1:763-1572(-)
MATVALLLRVKDMLRKFVQDDLRSGQVRGRPIRSLTHSLCCICMHPHSPLAVTQSHTRSLAHLDSSSWHLPSLLPCGSPSLRRLLCVCVCVCIRAGACACIYVRIYSYIYIYMCVCTYVRMSLGVRYDIAQRPLPERRTENIEYVLRKMSALRVQPSSLAPAVALAEAAVAASAAAPAAAPVTGSSSAEAMTTQEARGDALPPNAKRQLLELAGTRCHLVWLLPELIECIETKDRELRQLLREVLSTLASRICIDPLTPTQSQSHNTPQ